MSELGVYPDATSLARAAAERFATLAEAAVAEHRTESDTVRGRFVVALSGGLTPRATYALLATDAFAARLSASLIRGKLDARPRLLE